MEIFLGIHFMSLLADQTLANAQPLGPTQPTSRPHSLANDLFEELQFFNQGKSLDDILSTPTVETLVLLIKYKLLQLKRYDRQIFDSVRSTREPYGDPAKAGADPAPAAAKSPVHQAKSPIVVKGGKGKDAKAVAPKEAKPPTVPTGSLAKNKVPGGAVPGRRIYPLLIAVSSFQFHDFSMTFSCKKFEMNPIL